MKKVRVDYKDLNDRQKENYNFQKVAARLADYGYNSIRLSDDYNGADFIALHIDGESMLRIQLKGRMTFHEKYYGKGLYIAFRQDEDVYVYPHDALREEMLVNGYTEASNSIVWVEKGSRSWRRVPQKLLPLLEKYKL
ncbi:hypothetical protein O2N63_08970 [Aliiroseovarius sp. KMU-50]|uniref:Endonuclease n=1 Tax=Aliiroseovarius salicola TaxID=3009082 RepID=A0ABT4W1C5_9RHOB|nr:hypothetical protein [Aliiroseovarius sp. KMU-50]MDA5094219.1 hypothetical protein [Aliiroseovarius sp. KMU-50]